MAAVIAKLNTHNPRLGIIRNNIILEIVHPVVTHIEKTPAAIFFFYSEISYKSHGYTIIVMTPTQNP